MNRIVLHIDMDAFFAQVEERENPHFRGRPIVVGADPREGNGRGVVSTANYEARRYGIHSALPISKAWRLCSGAVFLPVNMLLYEKVSQRIMEIVKKYSDIYEIIGIDEAYLDISSCGNYKKAEKIGKKLKEEIFEEERLTCTIGIGPNKMIAKIASGKGKPNGLLIIRPEGVSDFLRPLDVEEIPGIGNKTGKVLKDMGIIAIGDLQNLDKENLKKLFGKNGESMFFMAQGMDEREVSNEEAIKSIGRDSTFEKDTRDPELIFSIFEALLKETWEVLVAEGFSGKTITVTCRFSGFETHTKSITFKEKIPDFVFFQREAKKLLLHFLLENKKPVRLVGVRTSSFLIK